MTHPVTLRLFIPGRLISQSNARTSWPVRAEYAARWRRNVRLTWLEQGRPTWEGPAHLTFHCYVRRLYDSDNLPHAVKAVRDEAVACICGSDDGPRSGHKFSYRQEARTDLRGVLIEVTACA